MYFTRTQNVPLFVKWTTYLCSNIIIDGRANQYYRHPRYAYTDCYTSTSYWIVNWILTEIYGPNLFFKTHTFATREPSKSRSRISLMPKLYSISGFLIRLNGGDSFIFFFSFNKHLSRYSAGTTSSCKQFHKIKSHFLKQLRIMWFTNYNLS